MLIRPAVMAEAAALTRIADDAYRVYLPRLDRRPAPMTADYAALITTGNAWVADETGSIVGFIVLASGGPDALLIENVAVHPAAQGRGVGRRLLAFAEAEAGRRDRTAVTLYTNQAMVENLTYYARLGYVETHRGEQDGFQRVFFCKSILPTSPPSSARGTDYTGFSRNG